MNTASISEIRNELNNLSTKELKELCLKLAKFKKENKEYTSYLLFDAHNPTALLQKAKDDISYQIAQCHPSNLYLGKKSIRKAVKTTNYYIKFANSPQIEVELLIHFCSSMLNCNIQIHNHPVIENIYIRAFNKAKKAISNLHEDLQYDYGQIIKNIEVSG
jgi:hypothetical protein